MLGLLPFALGYLYSYLLRSAGASLAGPMARDLGLSPAVLGALNALFFLAFALAQVPLGYLLERRGPSHILSALFGVAALGCFLVALSPGLGLLALGRLAMGVGVATALVGALRAYQLLAPGRLGLLSGLTVALGGWGASFHLACGPVRRGLGLAGGLRGPWGLGPGPRPLGAGGVHGEGGGAQGRRGSGPGKASSPGPGGRGVHRGLLRPAELLGGGLRVPTGAFRRGGGRGLGLAQPRFRSGGLRQRGPGGGPGNGGALGLGIGIFMGGFPSWVWGRLEWAYALLGFGGGFNGLVLALTAARLPGASSRAMAWVNLAGVLGIFLVQAGTGPLVKGLGYEVAFWGLSLLQGLALALLWGALRGRG